MVQRGTSTRSELSTLHEQQHRVFEKSLTAAIEKMEAAQKRVGLQASMLSSVCVCVCVCVCIHSVCVWLDRQQAVERVMCFIPNPTIFEMLTILSCHGNYIATCALMPRRVSSMSSTFPRRVLVRELPRVDILSLLH